MSYQTYILLIACLNINQLAFEIKISPEDMHISQSKNARQPNFNLLCSNFASILRILGTNFWIQQSYRALCVVGKI